ncbi:transposase family protein [Streptomyces californicus]
MFGVNRPTVTRAIGEVWPLLAERGCTVAPDIRLTTFAEVVDHLGASGQAWIIDGTEVRARRPAVGRKGREKFISGKSKQNAVKSMVVKDSRGRLLFCCPAEPASCADITHARKLGLLKLLADGPSVEIPADAGYQSLGAQTGGHVVTPPHRKFKRTLLSGTRRCTGGSARSTHHAPSGSSAGAVCSLAGGRTGEATSSPKYWRLA